MNRKSTSKDLLQVMSNQKLTNFIKLAQDDNKNTFEQNFYQLTDTIIQENFPRLLDYDLGFQLVDKEKDNSKAFGIRGFRLRTLVFIPFFYDNGKINGYEILYLPKQNLILPNTESWRSYLRHSDSVNMGESRNDYRKYYGLDSPDLLVLRRPITTKSGEYAKKLLEPSNLNHDLMMPEAIQNRKIASCLLATVDKYPHLAEPIIKLYGANLLKQAIDVASRPVYPQTGNYIPLELQEKAAKLKIYSDIDIPMDLRNEEIDELRKKGYFIKDAREDDEINEPVPYISDTQFFTVNKPGIYEILTINGQNRISTKNVVVVRDENGRNYIIHGGVAHTSNVPIEAVKENVTDWDNVISRLPKITASMINNARIKSILPKKYKNPDYAGWIDILVMDKYGNVVLLCFYKDKNKEWEYTGDQVLQGNGNKIKIYNNESLDLSKGPFTRAKKIIPKDCRAVVVERNSKLTLLNASSFLDKLYKSAELVKVYFDHGEYVIDNKRLEKLGALSHLMRRYNLREDSALNIIKEAQEFKQTRKFVKKAQDWAPFKLNQEDNPSAYFPESPVGVFAPGYPAKRELETETWVQGIKKPVPVKNIMEPPPLDVITTLKRVSEFNDGEVFDAALLSSMLHTTDEDSMVSRYIPKLIKALDSLGRILSNLYRHRDRLEDYYGKEDYTKIVDATRTNFENLGDLVTDLSRQEIDPYVRSMEFSESSASMLDE